MYIIFRSIFNDNDVLCVSRRCQYNYKHSVASQQGHTKFPVSLIAQFREETDNQDKLENHIHRFIH